MDAPLLSESGGGSSNSIGIGINASSPARPREASARTSLLDARICGRPIYRLHPRLPGWVIVLGGGRGSWLNDVWSLLLLAFLVGESLVLIFGLTSGQKRYEKYHLEGFYKSYYVFQSFQTSFIVLSCVASYSFNLWYTRHGVLPPSSATVGESSLFVLLYTLLLWGIPTCIQFATLWTTLGDVFEADPALFINQVFFATFMPCLFSTPPLVLLVRACAGHTQDLLGLLDSLGEEVVSAPALKHRYIVMKSHMLATSSQFGPIIVLYCSACAYNLVAMVLATILLPQHVNPENKVFADGLIKLYVAYGVTSFWLVTVPLLAIGLTNAVGGAVAKGIGDLASDLPLRAAEGSLLERGAVSALLRCFLKDSARNLRKRGLRRLLAPHSTESASLAEVSRVSVEAMVLRGQPALLSLAYQQNRHPLKLRLLGWYLSLPQLAFSLVTYALTSIFSLLKATYLK